jgi:uncharacterized protein YydD (DUF2326 family)
MKVDVLRKLIREEVRAAIKEELSEVLTEAVKIASAPVKETKSNDFKPVTQKDIKRTWSTGKMNSGTVPLEEMLQQTAQQMTSEDAKHIAGAGQVSKPNFASSMASQMGMTQNSGPMPGIDISQLDFVKKAKAVLDLSNEKDQNKIA